MNFAPRPENSFREFIDTYWNRCREHCPKLRVIAGKWTFEDLIPGLSDFDTRLVFDNGVTVPEWISMSIEVGNVHTQLAQEQPRWARLLEHLPGLNLTHAEITDPLMYYPEFKQWTYYEGDTEVLKSLQGYLQSKPWTRRDEIFYLKKFSTYYGPYQRGIDPPINIGDWENKYPLHSRYMHYFTPPVQAAVSLVTRAGIPGKFEALRRARELFPHSEVIDSILDAVAAHYEIPQDVDDPRLSAIEESLHDYLRDVYAALTPYVSLIRVDPDDAPETLKAKVAAIPIDPEEAFYEGTKFCRFMKGRLVFYSTPIAWFDTSWLIRNELGRMVGNFYEKPLATFGYARFGEKLHPEVVLEKLEGSLLSTEICDGVRTFVRVAEAPVQEGEEKQRAREVAEVFEPLQWMIETLGDALRQPEEAKART